MTKQNPPPAEEVRKQGNRYNLAHEEIVRAWQTSATVAEVLEKLGSRISYGALQSRAQQLRKRGVPLKRMSGRQTFYTPELIASLTKLAESLNGDVEK